MQRDLSIVGIEEEVRAAERRLASTALKNLKSDHRLSNIMAEQRREDELDDWRGGRFLFNPYSSKMQMWDVVLVFGLVYTAIFTPFDASFLTPAFFDAIFFFNLVVDLIFVADIVVTFNLPYVDFETGLWITSRLGIARNYLRGWFTIDLLSVLPFDYVLQAAYGDRIDAHALRALRLLKLLKLARILRTNRIWRRWRERVSVNQTKLWMALYITVIIVVAHWFACILGVFPYIEGSAGDGGYNWQVRYFEGALGLDLDSVSVGSLYLTSFYWSIAIISTTGFGDVTAATDSERLFVTILMFFGASLQAYLIGAVCGLVAELNENSTDRRIAMNQLNDFMRIYDFPDDLRVRLRKYFFYLYAVKDSSRFRNLTQMLSPHLQNEVNLLVNSVWVKAVPFVRLAPEHELAEFVSELCKRVRIEVFAPFERVVDLGERVDKLYIISKGMVVLHVTSSPLDMDADEESNGNLHVRNSVSDGLREELIHGECFGYELVYPNYRALYNATTLQFSELHVLDKHSLNEALDMFPETAAAISEFAQSRKDVYSVGSSTSASSAAHRRPTQDL